MRRKPRRYTPYHTPVECLEGRLLLAAQIVGSSTTYATIQAAVDAATPGATVTVDAGNYPELVGINKTLTIKGARAGTDARGNTRAAWPAGESVVSGESVGSATSSGFYIVANDVTIDGFTVQGNTSAGMYGAGIVIAPNVAGTHILNNVLQNNIAGLYLSNSSTTDAAVVQYNVFRNNNNAGVNGGRGIYTDASISGGKLTNVTIDSNFFLNNFGGAGTTELEAAIGLESLTPNAQSNIRISNNVMEGNGKAVLAYNAANLTITGNTVTTILDQWSGALRFEGGVTNVTITGNNLYANTGPAIHIDEKTIATTSSGFTVTGNNVFGNSSAYGSPAAGFIVNGSGAYTGTLDARNNWWGAAGGPSGELSGGGDGLFTNGNNVLYSPWSTTPAVNRDTPFNGLAASTGAPIQAEDFNQGGQGFAYSTATNSNSAGNVYRNTGVGITATGDVDGAYNLAYTAPGQWLDYAINVTTAGTYRIDFRVASSQATGGSFHVNLDGANVTGPITVPNTGGWQAYQTIASGAFSITTGKHVLRVVMDANGSGGAIANFNWFQLSTSPLPSVPQNFSVTPASGTELDLAWTQSGNAVTAFTLYRQTGAGAFVQLAQLGANAWSYNDANLAPNTTYSYKLIATNAAGNSLPAGPITATTPVPPGAPTNLKATNITATSLLLSWQAPANVTGYQITRQAGAGSPQILATLGASATSFTDTGLTAATAYQYVISASNVSGTGAGAALVATTVTLAPTGLAAVSNQNQITLTWNAASGATSYNVYRGTSSGNESATAVAFGIVGTGFVDPALIGGTTYYYVIAAVNAGGISARGSEASAKIVEVIPPAPTGLSAGASQGRITLSWSVASGVTSYRIYRGANPGAEDLTPLAGGISGTSYTDTTGAAGITYYYQISAVNGAGEGGRSAETSVALPVAMPTGLVASADASQITLTWATGSPTATYRVYRGGAPAGESATPLTSGLTTGSFIDTTAAVGTTYYYVVTAFDGSLESSPSAEASAALAPAVEPFVLVNTSALSVSVAGAFPASVVAGQKLNAKQVITLVNQSHTAWSGSANGTFYLSLGDGLNSTAIALPASFAKKMKLAPGARLTISYKLAGIPASVPAGAYHLVFQATDSTGQTSTTASAATITVVPPQIHLTGAFSRIPVGATAGKKLVATFTVTNHGNTTLAAPLPIDIHAAPAGKADADILLTQLQKPLKLAPGKSTTITVMLIVPAAFTGPCVVTVRLDPSNTLQDPDPTDNSFTTPHAITIL